LTVAIWTTCVPGACRVSAYQNTNVVFSQLP